MHGWFVIKLSYQQGGTLTPATTTARGWRFLATLALDHHARHLVDLRTITDS